MGLTGWQFGYFRTSNTRGQFILQGLQNLICLPSLLCQTLHCCMVLGGAAPQCLGQDQQLVRNHIDNDATSSDIYRSSNV